MSSTPTISTLTEISEINTYLKKISYHNRMAGESKGIAALCHIATSDIQKHGNESNIENINKVFPLYGLDNVVINDVFGNEGIVDSSKAVVKSMYHKLLSTLSGVVSVSLAAKVTLEKTRKLAKEGIATGLGTEINKTQNVSEKLMRDFIRLLDMKDAYLSASEGKSFLELLQDNKIANTMAPEYTGSINRNVDIFTLIDEWTTDLLDPTKGIQAVISHMKESKKQIKAELDKNQAEINKVLSNSWIKLYTKHVKKLVASILSSTAKLTALAKKKSKLAETSSNESVLFNEYDYKGPNQLIGALAGMKNSFYTTKVYNDNEETNDEVTEISNEEVIEVLGMEGSKIMNLLDTIENISESSEESQGYYTGRITDKFNNMISNKYNIGIESSEFMTLLNSEDIIISHN